MITDTFKVSLADAVFLGAHHDGHRSGEVRLPDGLLSFLREGNHLQSAGFQEIYSIFDILDAAHINQ